MKTETHITFKLSRLRPGLATAIENIIETCPPSGWDAGSGEQQITLDYLAHATTTAFKIARTWLQQDPDDREARSLVYDAETVVAWLQHMIFL